MEKLDVLMLRAFPSKEYKKYLLCFCSLFHHYAPNDPSLIRFPVQSFIISSSNVYYQSKNRCLAPLGRTALLIEQTPTQQFVSELLKAKTPGPAPMCDSKKVEIRDKRGATCGAWIHI